MDIIPMYEIAPQIRNAIEDIRNQKLQEYSENEGKSLDYRPFRPNDFNPAMNVANRQYDTINITPAWMRILAMAAAKTVETNNHYLFIGWWFVPDPLANFSQNAVVRIRINEVFKHEAPLSVIASQPNNMFFLLEQVVEAGPNDVIELEVRDANGPNDAIIYPLGYRYGPPGQIKVT